MEDGYTKLCNLIERELEGAIFIPHSLTALTSLEGDHRNWPEAGGQRSDGGTRRQSRGRTGEDTFEKAKVATFGTITTLDADTLTGEHINPPLL